MITGIVGMGQSVSPYSPYVNRTVAAASSLGKTINDTVNTDQSSSKVRKEECQTCNERKYVDGSNESNVSFKSPGHISPENSAAKVMAHEKEHVSNAVREGNKKNKELLSSTVTMKTAVCPECGTTYVSGGTTKTTMKTYSDNPYDQAKKSIEGSLLSGQNIDYVA